MTRTRLKDETSLNEIDTKENDERRRKWHKRFGPEPAKSRLKRRKAGPVDIMEEKQEHSVELFLSSDGESVKEEVLDEKGVKGKSRAEESVDDGPKPVGPVTREVKEEVTAEQGSKAAGSKEGKPAEGGLTETGHAKEKALDEEEEKAEAADKGSKAGSLAEEEEAEEDPMETESIYEDAEDDDAKDEDDPASEQSDEEGWSEEEVSEEETSEEEYIDR